MKVSPENWPDALAWLPRWEALSPAARAAWLTIKPSPGAGPLPPRLADELMEAGLMTPPGPKGTHYRVVAEARPLLRVMRAMSRVPVFDLKAGAVEAYLREHFTNEQISLLDGEAHGYWGWGSRVGELAERASSVEWIQLLLEMRDADGARTWEAPRRPPSEPLLLADPWTLAALQRLVLALKDQPQGVPLRQVHEILAEVDPAHRAAALAAGARYLFLFPALRGTGVEAWVGLLPQVAARMGPPPPAPEPVQAAESFEAPFRLADMTAVMVEAATEPIPVRASDYSLYVRAQKEVASRLVSLPGWARDVLVAGSPEEEDEDAEPVTDRISSAVGLLTTLKLVQMRSSGGRHRLGLTRAGERWLALGESGRLREVLNAFRASAQRVPGSMYGDPGTVDFFGARFAFLLPEKGLDLRQALADAFLSVPAGTMVPVAEFAGYHAQVRNPLLASGATPRRDRWGGRLPASRESWEAAWAALLMGFLFLRLAPFAGARLGRLEGDRVAFGVTDAGRYLLGAADDFELAPEPGGGEVVVQPDFEIVFLAPAPRAEAELGRIAERRGAGVGALFRLTRASVLRAAEQGMSAAQVLATLESVSRSGVPANVARQVQDWMKSVRSIRIAPAVLIECPDAETAGRVQALGGAQITAVTPTVLRLHADARARAALVKRLRERGIFVGSGEPAAAADTPPGRKRR